jgi:hypothetical protein
MQARQSRAALIGLLRSFCEHDSNGACEQKARTSSVELRSLSLPRAVDTVELSGSAANCPTPPFDDLIAGTA